MSPGNISNIEKDIQGPSLESAVRISMVFDITLDELIFNTAICRSYSEKILVLYMKLSEDDKEMVEKIIMRMLSS